MKPGSPAASLPPGTFVRQPRISASSSVAGNPERWGWFEACWAGTYAIPFQPRFPYRRRSLDRQSRPPCSAPSPVGRVQMEPLSPPAARQHCSTPRTSTVAPVCRSPVGPLTASTGSTAPETVPPRRCQSRSAWWHPWRPTGAPRSGNFDTSILRCSSTLPQRSGTVASPGTAPTPRQG